MWQHVGARGAYLRSSVGALLTAVSRSVNHLNRLSGEHRHQSAVQCLTANRDGSQIFEIINFSGGTPVAPYLARVRREPLVTSSRKWLLAGILLAVLIFAAGPARAGVLDASWTAPTTNTDGSALTDLGSYRIYYGPATAPCPGPAFFQVASPTSSPASGTTVSFRLPGLTTGTQYFVSVSAVDLGGSESACSLTANAVPQNEFSVTPTGSVGFGNVNLGSFADQTFTVQNARGGVVSGTVSTSAPFSIVSGGSFSLGGVGSGPRSSRGSRS